MISFIKKVWQRIARYWREHKNFRRIVGVFAIIYGLIALITPIMPGAWFIFVGLELLGVRILFWQKLKSWFFVSVRFLWGKGRYVRWVHVSKVFMALFVLLFR